MKFLEKLKSFFVSDWAQVVQTVVAIASVASVITGRFIDSAKIAEVIGQFGIAALGIIWLIETIINVFSKKNET
jgi:ABC-type polysaccharide/polyol phosphate export permease